MPLLGECVSGSPPVGGCRGESLLQRFQAFRIIVDRIQFVSKDFMLPMQVRCRYTMFAREPKSGIPRARIACVMAWAKRGAVVCRFWASA